MRGGISVREALALPSLRRARVVGGLAGLERHIRCVNVMEVPDILPFVKADELLLTTGYPMRDEPQSLEELVPRLAERGLAALAIAPQPYMKAIAPRVVALADELGFPIVELPDRASFNEIIADVLEVILNRQAVQLERAQSIHERLTAVVLQGGSFAQLLRTLTDLLHVPTAILDADGHVVATSDDAVDPPQPGSRVVRPITIGGTRLGEIVAARGGEALSAEDLMAMDQAATVAALQMAQARTVLTREERHRAVLLDELVSGYPIHESELREHAAALGWTFSVPRAAVAIGLRDASGRELLVAGSPLEERTLRPLTATLDPRAIVWARRAGIALLVDASEAGAPRASAELASRKVRASVPDATVSVGIGRPRSRAAELHASYGEALQALAIGRDLHPAGGVLSFEELGVYRLLHSISSEPELRRYCDDLLGALAEHDRKHSSDLLRTLEAYLRNERNVAATARELFVHYNTLRYRLRKIDDLVGGLDRTQNMRLSVEVALHALRMLGATAPN